MAFFIVGPNYKMFDATTLDAWLAHIEQLHAKQIDLGLDRMKRMLAKMAISFQNQTVITVGGTNGKGSTCAMLESIYRTAGYTTGMHTSPHLIRMNERCVLNGREVSDERLMAAFRQVEAARGEMTLSFFEYTALAILLIFMEEKVDVVILEVGLGGRLDAINTVDSDAAVVTTVGIDHVAFLGDTREKIGFEKAHIFRPACPAVCSEPDVPQTVLTKIDELGAVRCVAGRDFTVRVNADTTFDFSMGTLCWPAMAEPALKGINQYQNVGGVLALVTSLQSRLPVSREQVEKGLASVRLTARFETITDSPVETVIDVGHNPQAAQVLRDNIARTKKPGEKTLAVIGMLADKDMETVTSLLRETFDEWFVASLTGPRAATSAQLSAAMLSGGVPAEKLHTFDDVASALAAARTRAETISSLNASSPKTDGKDAVRIIIFGSFVTVTAALEIFSQEGIQR